MKFNFIIPLMVLVFILLAILYPGLSQLETAKASSLEPGCEAIGTIGNIIISRCYDEKTGAIFYGNSNGWLSNPLE